MKQCYLCKIDVEKLNPICIIPPILQRLPGESVPLLQRDLNYRTEFLCNSCQPLFDRWERFLKREFNDILAERSDQLEISPMGDRYLIINGIKSDHTKMALLSIFWRMSFSQESPLNTVNLGPHREKIEEILLNRERLNPYDYPLVIRVITGKIPKEINVKIRGNHSNSIVTLYLIAGGFQVILYLKKGLNIEELEPFSYAKLKTVVVQKIDGKRLK